MSPKPLERVLLVEDDPDIRTIALFALEAVDGVAVKACGSGAEALREAPGFAPRLVLLDVMMPELDGPATLAGLRSLPGLEHTPVVFMTAKVQPEEIARYKALGAVDVIPKPFDALTLGEVVLSIWERLAAADAEADEGDA